jgi:hypothetical protein
MTARLLDPERWSQVAIAALAEVGVNARCDNPREPLDVDVTDIDPRILWRASYLADRAVGAEPAPFDVWCADEREAGLLASAYLDRWGCP